MSAGDGTADFQMTVGRDTDLSDDETLALLNRFRDLLRDLPAGSEVRVTDFNLQVRSGGVAFHMSTVSGLVVRPKPKP